MSFTNVLVAIFPYGFESKNCQIIILLSDIQSQVSELRPKAPASEGPRKQTKPQENLKVFVQA